MPARVKGGLRLKLRTLNGTGFDELPLDSLHLHLRGSEGMPSQLYELLLGASLGVAVTPGTTGKILPAASVPPLRMSDHETLLPVTNHSFPPSPLPHDSFAFAHDFPLMA